MNTTPQIDIRLSTTGILEGLSVTSPPPPASPEPSRQLLSEPAGSSLAVPTNGGLLSAPLTTPRGMKRRSFLPIDAPGGMSLSIPENSAFVSGVVVAHDGEDQPGGPSDSRVVTPSPVLDHEQYVRREEDRARDAYMRALRSVMAYLKDMNDLGTVQQQHSNPLSMYGSSAPSAQAQDDYAIGRPRRPTMAESQREVSVALSGSTTMVSDSSGHLRSSDSIAGLRSGSSSQTLSVATTDSSGSSEERKFKDDKGKRAMVIREIVL